MHSLSRKVMKVGVKFCGGCNPDYDWEEFWRRLKAVAGEKIEWVRWVEEDRDALLLINCCSTACAEEDAGFDEGLPGVVSVKGDVSPEEVVRLIMGASAAKSDENMEETIQSNNQRGGSK